MRSCEKKCDYLGFRFPVPGTNTGKTSDGRVGQKVMRAVEGSGRFEIGEVHGQCADCLAVEKECELIMDEFFKANRPKSGKPDRAEELFNQIDGDFQKALKNFPPKARFEYHDSEAKKALAEWSNQELTSAKREGFLK